MADTALVALPPSSALARVGLPNERQYLIEIMAETLGIPSKDATRPDVVAILGMAVQRTSQYGWLTGVHMHCQKFETADSRKRRQSNPQSPPEYTYTLVDGEKAWKDSGSRWRILYGINWTYNRRQMTPEELTLHARQMGYDGALPGLACGFWSRVIVVGTDDPKDPDNPLFSGGVFLGKRKVGNNWYDEDLPTQVTSRDVAIRRADKRAMMQSPLTLLPVDDMTPAARLEKLTDHLRQESLSRRDDRALMQRDDDVIVEPDGDMLWVKPEAARPRADARPPEIIAARPPEIIAARPPAVARLENSDVDFYGDAVTAIGAVQTPSIDPPVDDGLWVVKAATAIGAVRAQPEAIPLAARVATDAHPDGGDGPCPDCHAPAGKAHATSCPQRQAPPLDARPPEIIAARPATPLDARPAANVDGVIESEYDVFALLASDSDSELPPEILAKLDEFHTLHIDSERPISEAQYNLLRVLIKSIFGGDKDDEHKMLLSALCGVAIDSKHRPGSKLGIIATWLKDPNKYQEEVEMLFVVMSICRQLRTELED